MSNEFSLALSQLRVDFETFKSNTETFKTSTDRRLRHVEALLSMSLPTLDTIIGEILTKVASAHLFWSHREGYWLSVAQVKRRELELKRVENRDEKGVLRIEDYAEEVMATCREREEADGFTPQRDRQQWRELQSKALSPIVSALPQDGYPQGRLATSTIENLKTTYISLVNSRNRGAHYFTAGAIADALLTLAADNSTISSTNPLGLSHLRVLFHIIFGAFPEHFPTELRELEIGCRREKR